MKRKNWTRWLVASAAALLVAACGGGGGADGGIGGSGGGGDGGIGGTGVSVGTITDFGSIWVNGVEFSTTGATVKFDDNPSAGEDKLRIGMVVRVDGSIPNATATTVTVDEAIKGRVEQGLSGGRMVVMGQTIQTDANTRFDNGVVPAVGDLVEVHGLIAGDGIVNAGYIEKKTTPANPPFVAKGIVKNHDTGAQTFQVGTLTVRYSGATTGDMPAGSWNGLQVEAKGSTCAGNPVCGTLTASKVEPAGFNVASAPQAEVEGIVLAVDATGFTIGNQRVVTTSSTVYENGVAADVTVGTKVEAEGAISNGVLTATKVSIRDGARIEGDVASVNAAAGTFTVVGLPGVDISLSAGAELDGLASVSDLAAGYNVRLRGRPGLSGGLVATRLELRDTRADGRLELRAAVDSISAPTVTLLGVAVDTSAISDVNFKDANDVSIGRTAFFAAIKAGSVVKFKGDLSGSAVTWEEAEIETP